MVDLVSLPTIRKRDLAAVGIGSIQHVPRPKWASFASPDSNLAGFPMLFANGVGCRTYRRVGSRVMDLLMERVGRGKECPGRLSAAESKTTKHNPRRGDGQATSQRYWRCRDGWMKLEWRLCWPGCSLGPAAAATGDSGDDRETAIAGGCTRFDSAEMQHRGTTKGKREKQQKKETRPRTVGR